MFRSEFLYLENSDYPTENQQFNAYKKVLESMAGKKVIIRTLDIGADKKCDYFNLKPEENPALGYRAIRICLTRPEVFKTQLRALYRASVFGNLGIMFPMITGVSELEKILAICDEVKAELKEQGVKFSDKVELGADTTLTETFLRMGVDELSVSPAFVLKVRDTVRNVDLSKA